MMRRKITALLLFEGLTIAALHSMRDLPGFGIRWRHLLLPTTRLDDAVASGLRFVALGLAYWMLFSSLLYLAARATEIPAAFLAIRWVTLPPIRRLADRALAVGLTVGTFTAPVQALAQAPPPPVEQTYVPTPAGVDEAEEPLVVLDGDTFIPPGASVPHSPTTVQFSDHLRPEGVTELPIRLLFDRQPTNTHEVADGENLWSIAQERVGNSTGTTPSDAEIVGYWSELIAANRHTLTSGDPDLIYPGEVLVLPPLAP